MVEQQIRQALADVKSSEGDLGKFRFSQGGPGESRGISRCVPLDATVATRSAEPGEVGPGTLISPRSSISARFTCAATSLKAKQECVGHLPGSFSTRRRTNR